MRQLNGLETLFLAMEDNNQPMHIATLRVYDPSTAPGGKVTFDDIFKYIESKLDEIPVYRRKLFKQPMRLDHPFWIEDEDFDLKNHIKNIAVPAPGDLNQLFQLSSQMHSQPLDLSRPPWEWWIIQGLSNIDGLPKNSYAILSKSHHALIDGGSDFEIENILHSHSPKPSSTASSTEWWPRKKPNRLELFALRTVNNLTNPFKLTTDLKNIGKGLAKAVVKRKLVLPRRAPKTRFNQSVSRNLVIGFHTVKLADIKMIKNAIDGVTVTDVAMAIISGAMRRYLDDKGDLPDKSLITINPVSVRKKEEQQAYGNQLGLITVSLCSNITDPLKRLRAVGNSSLQAKEMVGAMGLRDFTNFANHLPGMAINIPIYYSKIMKTLNPSLYNTTISSIAGSQKPLFMNGAQLLDTYGLGFIFDGHGLFHGVNSYNGKFVFCVTSCRDMMPDPEFYVKCIQDSFEELIAAIPKQTVKKAKKPSKAKTSAEKKESTKTKASDGTKESGKAKGPAAEPLATKSDQADGGAKKPLKAKSSAGAKKSEPNTSP